MRSSTGSRSSAARACSQISRSPRCEPHLDAAAASRPPPAAPAAPRRRGRRARRAAGRAACGAGRRATSTPVIVAVARFHISIARVGVDHHDAVGDRRDDRLGLLLLLRDALVQEGVLERDGGGVGERLERLELVGLPHPAAAVVQRQHAAQVAVGRQDRRTQVGREAGACTSGSSGRKRSSAAMSATATRRAARQHLAGRPAGERRLLAGEQLGGLALHGAHHEAVALDEAQRARVGVQQQRGLRDDLAQHGGRVEVGGHQAADALQLLGAGAGPALGRQRLGALDGGGGGGAEVARQVEVVVARGMRLGPHDAEHGGAGRRGLHDRHAERRALAGLEQAARAPHRTRGGRTRRRRRARSGPRARPAAAARRPGRRRRRAPAWSARSRSPEPVGLRHDDRGGGPQRAAGGGRRPRCRSRPARAVPASASVISTKPARSTLAPVELALQRRAVDGERGDLRERREVARRRAR